MKYVPGLSMLRSILLAVGLLAAATAFGEATAPATAAHPEKPGVRLRALFAASDEATLKRNPIRALFRGDPRYADQFGDYISDAYFAAEKQAAVHDLAALAHIDRS